VKAHLLHEDRDFILDRPLPWNEGALVKDLSLDTLFAAMARGDALIFEVSKKAILLGLENDLETISYRQRVLQDCLNQPEVIRELYTVSVEAIREEKKHYLSTFARYPDSVLRYSTEMMNGFLGMLKALRRITESNSHKFVSEGWSAFFAMLRSELNDEFFARVEYHLDRLTFRGGVLLSAKLGKGNKGDRYVLREPPHRKASFLARLFTQQPPAYSFTIHPRDESGFAALGDLRNRGIALVADTLAQSTGHVRSFFDMLRTELAFYVGCVNLHEDLGRRGVPVVIPSPVAAPERRLSFQGLRDVCLALSTDEQVVGNDLNADGQDLVIVTGANQGGKSTFLRGVGLAQLMMQCGMFVGARAMCASVQAQLFTHYKREEDAGMNSGKLDEELSRMSDIIDHIRPHAMILFNESFAATNEREGSEIARQILSALMNRRIKIVCVTHLHELARAFHENNNGNTMFLRAERQADGARTFKLLEGEPLETSFGEDIYKSIFGG
jgi:DNA mismatch repair ATPase MutS